jgi:plasmid stabilization system protein ParE
MTRRLVVSSAADLDMFQIWMRIAQDSLPSADRMAERFQETFDLLCRQPEIGEAIPESKIGGRIFTVGSYLVLHYAADETLCIARVVHGARQLADLIRRGEA